MASKLFWFRTQPRIKNASTMIQMSVTADPTTVIVRMSCTTAIPVRLR